MSQIASIPMQNVGPILIKSAEAEGEFIVPMATFETPLWPSVNRGAKLSKHCGGIHAVVTRESMTRSIAVEAPSAQAAHSISQAISNRLDDMQQVVSQTSRFAKLQAAHTEQLGKVLYIRLSYFTGDASGHNMATLASDKLQAWLIAQYPELRYITVTANFCTDKKVSAVNGILGRGKSVTAEITVPKKLCQRFLKVAPQDIVEVHIKKNLMGSTLAGSLRSANAHYANMLLAFYLATGQDAANIVEGSQGITHCEVNDGDLYFSVNLPNVIVGTVGNGKGLDFVQENLKLLGCTEQAEPGVNARKLAVIATSTVLCGELSLMGALANQGELMQSHVAIERNTRS